MELVKRWKLRKALKRKNPCCLPGDAKDFLKFLGVGKKGFRGINYLNIIDLPGIKGKVINCRIFPDTCSKSTVWRCQYEERIVEGRGKSPLEAAFDALLICWVFSAKKN